MTLVVMAQLVQQQQQNFETVRIESPTTLPFFVQDIIPAALPQLLPWESDSIDAKLCLSFLQ